MPFLHTSPVEQCCATGVFFRTAIPWTIVKLGVLCRVHKLNLKYIEIVVSISMYDPDPLYTGICIDVLLCNAMQCNAMQCIYVFMYVCR